MLKSKLQTKKIFIGAIMCIIVFSFLVPVFAAAPTGADWFQLLTGSQTGSDNTGDGGTGDGDNLNYYYVGQTFTGTIQINSDTGANAANIWIDYNTATITATSLTTGSYFTSWSGQTISGGRIKSTGYRTSGYSTGAGTFGTVDFTMVRPSAASYGTTTPETLDINIGTVGSTTESNISRDGDDILDDEEDFQLNIWADTNKPYALNPSPSNTASNVSVSANYTFDLRDSKNGEGDNSGVGTGVDTSTPPGAITFDDGSGASSYTSYDSYSCSGVWSTNLCNVTINPGSPLSISGDTRNWKYNTTYTAQISGFLDQASASQDQLGDANGPNTMDTKTWTFTTETDSVAPQVATETPTRSSTGNSVSANLVIDVTDRKTYPSGPSGSGVASTTCSINVSSPSFTLTTYTTASSEVTTTAIDYGYRFTIDPATDFSENETVSVSVYDCQDTASAPNTMTTDNYTFSTTDASRPYVDGRNPANDATIALDGTITLHIKDDGVGVDLDETYIYVNGEYYSNGGGAISITTSGTRITSATSSDFNGSNYSGDTTGVSGTAADYTFVIDPEINFATDEAVPVLVYSADTGGNLMERVVYALPSSGSSCATGSTYCGTNTTWSGSQCVGTGGSSASIGGGPQYLMSAKISNVTVSQVDEHSVVVSWFNGVSGTGWVAYDTKPSSLNEEPPYYGYRYKTEETEDESTYHTIVIRGLEPGTLYYFRPASKVTNDLRIHGREVQMAPRFAQKVIKEFVTGDGTVVYRQEQPKEIIVYRDISKKCVLPTNQPADIGNLIETGKKEEPKDKKEEKDTILFIIPKELVKSSPWLTYGLLTLILLVIVNTLRLRNQMSVVAKGLMSTGQRKKLISWYAIIGILVLVAVAVLGVRFGWFSLVERVRTNVVVNVDTPSIVSGAVVEPLNHQGVEGVDLTVGDTTIHTVEGGYYVFNNLAEGDTIKINHPLLKRSIIRQIEGNKMNIYFDTDLYNDLVYVLDFEVREEYSKIYGYLPEEVQSKISLDEFVERYETGYTGSLSDQDLIISETEIIPEWVSDKYDIYFGKALRIRVVSNGYFSDYYFVHTNGLWKIVK